MEAIVTNTYQGLTDQQAKAQLIKFGPNVLAEKRKQSAFFEFLSRFKNPLLLILLASAVASGFLGDIITAIIIILIIVASVVIDFVNTYKSEKAAEDLKKRVMITTTVMRNGVECELPLSSIVPDDVIVLHPGDIIPADGEVAMSRDLYVNESELTGESYPVEKEDGSQVFMGSSVNTGSALLIVHETGKNTKFSHIAATLEKAKEPTEFDISIRKFSTLIMKITFIMVFFILLINIIFKHNIFQSFLFAVALAVGLTPELLPMIIAINLSRGSLEMAKRGVIVKKLSAIQNFGNMDILCTDKTGTLTEDRITVIKYVDGYGKDSDEVLQACYISSTLSTSFRSPLDAAIKEYKKLDISGYSKIDEVPFDYERRRDSIIIDQGGNHMLISKGAPEQLITACNLYGMDNVPITAELRETIIKQYEELSADGFRVLGVAEKSIPNNKSSYSKEDENGMVFHGFIAFLDPAKPSVTETLQMLEGYGIEIKILTGDNEIVTKKITEDILLPVKGIILGSEVELLSDAQLEQKVEDITIFARVTPDQKERIIKALRSRGHVVGYLGDGINDAPPLKACDVGISVENAVDVAKDTADLILLKKSLQDLVEGVIEGRKTFANTLKYLMMATSSNFGNMFSMAGASALLPFLPMTAPQILLNNILYDSSQFAIPSDNVDESDMKKPRKFKIGFIKRFMLVFGPISSIFDFATFFVLIGLFHLHSGAFQTGWFLESIVTQTLVVYIIRTRKIPFIESIPSKTLIMSTILTVGIAISIIYLPINKLFGFIPLGLHPILFIIGITLVYFITIEIAKRWFYNTIAQKY